MWLAYAAKWIHLILVTLLIGSMCSGYWFGLSAINQPVSLWRQQLWRVSCWGDRAALIMFILLALTGTLLVHPKGYTFQTPWIDAAYIFLSCAVVLFVVLTKIKARLYQSLNGDGCKGRKFFYHAIYAVILIVLTVIAFEAVSKQTFLVV
ncbi:MAG: DUF2269 family protein [Coxiellaceae bacterium]|nr:DUF2269 family protein [Coxiellaceae bacterium]